MKKIISNKISRVCLVALLGFMMFQTGCKKEDTNSQSQESISGTTWKGSYNANEDGVKWREEYTVIFYESTFSMSAKIIEDDGSSNTEKMTGTFVFKHPNITLNGINEDGDDFSATATISGNKMTFNNKGQSLIFTKQ